MKCERYLSIGQANGYLQCSNPAAWRFNYWYLEHNCDCKDRNCPVHREESKGFTNLCDACYQHDLKHLRHPTPDNIVAPDKQYTKL